MTDRVHHCTTFAVVFVNRMGIPDGRTGALTNGERAVADKHFLTVRGALDAVLSMKIKPRQWGGVADTYVRVIEIPEGEPHDYDGTIVAALRLGRGCE